MPALRIVIPALVPFLLVVACSPACASSGSGPVDLQNVATATLPATIAQAVIVSGTPISTSGQQRYTVKSGDNPSSIAAQFGITVDELMTANGITDPTSLHTGDVLIIPLQSTPSPQALQPSETPQPTAGPTATPPPAGNGQTYTVQDGDIPETIAARFGITAQELMEANGITDPTSLQVGQVLVVPTPSQ